MPGSPFRRKHPLHAPRSVVKFGREFQPFQPNPKAEPTESIVPLADAVLQ
jgi:hypothetical protein